MGVRTWVISSREGTGVAYAIIRPFCAACESEMTQTVSRRQELRLLVCVALGGMGSDGRYGNTVVQRRESWEQDRGMECSCRSSVPFCDEGMGWRQAKYFPHSTYLNGVLRIADKRT